MALIVVVPRLSVAAIAIYPFILVKTAAYKNDDVLINHEKIHHRQQLELLILPFYILYFIHYLVNLIAYKSHYQAYLHIVFEKEAYAEECNLQYLAKRELFAWLKWFKQWD